MTRLQELREEAEKARDAALSARHEADKTRGEYERKTQALTAEAAELAGLLEMRSKLQPGDYVHVARFDATGKVARVNALKQTVTVGVGIAQWEVPFDEIFPKRH